MKATAGRRPPVGRTMKTTAGSPQPVDQGYVPFASSVMLSVVLHGILILWMLGSAWLLGRAQPYRLTSQTVYLAGDSPIALNQMPGEGGGVAGARPESKETGGVSKPVQGGEAEPSVDKFAPPVEKPVLPPPKPVTEKTVSTPPPKPVVEKTAPPPPKPVVEKPVPPVPVPKPAVEKEVPVPPEALALAQKQKETKPTIPPVPFPPTPTEAQQKVAKLRERQLEQETVEAKKATEAQQKMVKLREQQAQQEAAEQRVASLRAEEAEKQAAQQRIAALRARVGSGGAGEGNGSAGGNGPGSGSAGAGRGSGAPGGGRGTGTAGAGGVGTGGLSGIRLRTYQAELQAKIYDAWNIPSRSKGLEATFFLSINRAGHVEQGRLVQGSGNALFDESLQRAIKQAQPLPALPEDFTNRTLDVMLTFRDSGR